MSSKAKSSDTKKPGSDKKKAVSNDSSTSKSNTKSFNKVAKAENANTNAKADMKPTPTTESTPTTDKPSTPISEKPSTPAKKAKSPPKRRPGQKKDEKAEEDMTEEEKAEKKRIDREIFVKEKCTTFNFVFKLKEGEKKPRIKTYIYEDKMECYADIQRCIARYIKSNNVFIVQTMDKKDILGPKDFVVAPEYRIKEVFAKKMIPEFYPIHSIKWDFYEYHGKPHNWTDFDEIRKRKKEEELAKAKEREEALKLLESMDNDDDD